MFRRLGHTSLPVTRIGLGLAALGRPGYINLGHAGDFSGHTDVAEMEARAHAVLDAAYAAGVRYFDAARSYGRAEEFLGSWLIARGLGRDDLTVGSKWGYTYTADWRVDAEVNEVKDLSIETLRRQEAETRSFLGDHLRLYQIHSATIESGVFSDGAVLEELARLRAGGVYIGCTATGPRQRDTIERALEVGGFDAVQATYNLLDPSAGPALSAAHDAGLGVIVKEAVANGRLTARGDVPTLLEAARARDVTPDALALAAVLAQPWVDVVLSGAATVAQLTSNLGAYQVVEGAGDELLERLAGQLAEDPEVYWETRSGLAWN
ncbi:MAG TPA: aldo/keto reductase [Solirubrobacteraceae bacterium]|nr:aldo/keto reductase [Solirubrobacteraceae bacterium]